MFIPSRETVNCISLVKIIIVINIKNQFLLKFVYYTILIIIDVLQEYIM